ncbi:MAG: TolC family protein [Thermomonas hydrothermalis]|uniref:TolC family protein n=1 Tax=Thermomonas hydrothermalis TaxID=213588 RepID=UPI002356A1F0|nr:TolC family protein [Thermomonas hydrothermalis]MCL6618598.1 TolC family protein [Thermomonas hydrothermalis]
MTPLRIRALLVLTLLAGCASYAPDPLRNDPAVLAPPAAEILQRRAEAITRSWLTPARIDLDAPLDANAVATLAVLNNPDLIALRAHAGVADAQVFAAGLLPDPSFSLGADRVLRGPDTLLNLTAALGLDLNALRNRTLTRAQAIAQARRVRLDLAWAEWQTAGQARLQAVRILGLQRQLPLLEAGAQAARMQAEQALRAAARGDLANSEAQALRLAAFDADTRLRDARQQLQQAEQSLARLLGLPSGKVPPLAAQPLPPPPPPAARLFELAQRERADLAALRAGYDAQEASVRLAVQRQFPALNLTINGNRDSAGNLLLGPAVDFTLPLWNRNRGDIAIERATRSALKADYEARLFQTRADLDAAVTALQQARDQLAQARVDAEALQQRAQAAQAAQARGDLPAAAALVIEQAWRDRNLLIVQLEQTIAEQTLAVELLCGVPLFQELQ